MGGRHRVKIVKNEIAATYRVTEFYLMYNEGISKEGELLALGEKFGIIKKAGASYSYLPGGDEDKIEKLGRGYDATRVMLKENKKLANQILKDIKKNLV